MFAEFSLALVQTRFCLLGVDTAWEGCQVWLLQSALRVLKLLAVGKGHSNRSLWSSDKYSISHALTFCVLMIMCDW